MPDSFYDSNYSTYSEVYDPRFPVTTVLYGEDFYFYQPNFIRHHHAHRSPMNSERMNLENDLFYYDVHAQYEVANEIANKLETYFRVLDKGSANVYQVNWYYDMATPAVQPDTVDSLFTMATELAALAKRIETLEKDL